MSRKPDSKKNNPPAVRERSIYLMLCGASHSREIVLSDMLFQDYSVKPLFELFAPFCLVDVVVTPSETVAT